MKLLKKKKKKKKLIKILNYKLINKYICNEIKDYK